MKSRLTIGCKAITLAVALLLVTTWAASDSGDSEPGLVLERITITGTAGVVDTIPGSAHSIDQEELDSKSYSDIHRILRSIPGVNVHEEEGFGLFPHIGLRGTRLERNSRVTVMEDGVLIAPAPYAAPAAYYFPQTGRMDRVEVRKGSAAIQYGPYTTGGAINLMSTPIPDEVSGKAHLLFGSHGSRRSHAWLGGADDQWGWLVEGYSSASDGFKRLDPVTGEGLPNAPEAGTGFEADNFLGKLRWNSTGGGIYQEFELKLAMDDRTVDDTYLGLTPEDFAADPFRRYRGSQLDQINTDHRQIQLRYFIAPTPDIDLTTTVYNMDFSRNWYKLHEVQDTPGGSFRGISGILAAPDDNTNAFAWIQGESDTGVLGNVRANNRDYYARGVQSQLAWNFDTGNIDHALEIGLRYHEDEEDRLQWQDSFRMIDGNMVLIRPGQESGAEDGAETGVPGSTTNRVTKAEARALSVYNTMSYGDWTFAPGFRVEDITYTRTDYTEGENPGRDVTERRRSSDTTAFLPGAGVTWRVRDDMTLLAGLHRGFAPTGLDSGGERSWNFETGLRYRQGSVSGSAIGFHTRYSNLVGVCTAVSGGGCEVGEEFDGGRVDVSGLELELGWDAGRAFDLPFALPFSLAYTRTNSEFKSSFSSGFSEWGEVTRGDELPQIPGDQLNLGVSLLWDRLAIHASANHVSETRAVAGSGPISDNERVDSRVLFDLSAEYRVGEYARLFASVENLTDETYLSARRPAGVRPGMPRTGWLGVKFDFR